MRIKFSGEKMIQRLGVTLLCIVLSCACQNTAAVVDSFDNIAAQIIVENMIEGDGEFGEPPRKSVTFANDDKTDVRIHMSLSQFDGTTINFENGVTSVPTRMNYWLSKVEIGGGQVAVCPTKSVSGFSPLIDWGVRIVSEAAEKRVREWALYNPADDQNVIMEIDPVSGEYQRAIFISQSLDYTDELSRYSTPCIIE